MIFLRENAQIMVDVRKKKEKIELAPNQIGLPCVHCSGRLALPRRIEKHQGGIFFLL